MRGAQVRFAVGLLQGSLVWCLTAGCGSSEHQATVTPTARSGGTDSPSTPTENASVDLSGTGEDDHGLGREGFRFGINLGHPNPDFGDSDMADLAANLGVKSIRLKYPEYHFANWGQDIEVEDAKHYASLGMRDHVAFVIGMTEAHSTAPAGKSDWERDGYIPKNLYEPIFAKDGSINPDNYYATYLAKTFTTYKTWVRYWEIFNEPDWVSDWKVTQTWDTVPPGKAGELERFHGTIFDYVRMLRIACLVRDSVAPGTFVLTGGLGYPSFLNAILRYTDNPDDGKVTDAYPKRGGEYFDVLSMHHYPHLVESGNSDAALVSLKSARDAFRSELDAANVARKGFMMTETGASHTAIAKVASGPEYARNYLQKAYVWSKAEGYLGVDWFVLSDGTSSTDPFSRMGLYDNVGSLKSTSDAIATDSGRAYRTIGSHLADCRFDVGETRKLGLGEQGQGYVFACPAGSVAVLWAASNTGESGTADVTVHATREMNVVSWDGSEGVTLTPVNDVISLSVSSSPTLLVPK